MKLKIKIKIILNYYGTHHHPGFLSFGSVVFYTLISPSSPYKCLTFSLGLADGCLLLRLFMNMR